MATHSYDRGGQPDGTIEVCNAPFYGGTHLCLALLNGDSAAHLTADRALELAADLVAHAHMLTAQSESEEAGEIAGYKIGDRVYHPDDVVIVRCR